MNIVHHIQKVRIKSILYYLCLISTIFSQGLPAKAQITPDNSLGAEASQLNQNVLIHGALGDKINGGAKRGSNVFHSFSEFNIQDGQRVYFANPSGVENILARVTGGKASNIFGTLGVDGAANLFLINPNGILFGENAQLDVQGSFVGTTANGVQFGNQGNFSATNPQAPALLTVNPSALFFNQINQGAGIQNNSIAAAGIDSAGFKTFGLRVPDGKSLLLVGGNVSVNGGWLNADGGRVELGGLIAPGKINLVSNGDNLSLEFPENVTRADVSLTNQAIVSVKGFGGGNIQINARNIEILDGSGLDAGIGVGLGKPETIAGNITLNGTGEIKIAGSESQIVNLVRPEAKGSGGNITIDSGSFSLQDGAMLSTSTFGQGNAGNVTVSAKNGVFLTNGNIFSTVEAGGIGKGGNININAATLSLTDSAQLQTSTSGASANQPAGRGDAGNVNIKVTGTVDIAGEKNGFVSAINSFMDEGTVGNGGNITINSGNFSLRDRAQLSASTLGEGNAGNVTVKAENAITLASNASILSAVEAGGVGKGGNINIDAATLSLTDGAQLQTATSSAFGTKPAGRGDAGNVNVKVTGTVDIAGEKNGFVSAINSFVDVGTVGNGGNIIIDCGDFSLRDGAVMSASTLGQGNAGNVTVSANNAISLTDAAIFSTVSAGAIGKGGNININAATLSLTDGAQLLTATSGVFNTKPAGRGDAGNVNINVTGTVNIAGQKNGLFSSISSFVDVGTVGNGGNITINSGNFSLRDGAIFSASTYGQGNAGNIYIYAKNALTVSGTSQKTGFSSGLFTFSDSNSIGKGGDITLNTNIFHISNGALLDARTRNNQEGGNITVNAKIFEALNGGQLTTTASNNGRAGKITVNADDKIIISGSDFDFDNRVRNFPGTVVNIGANSGLFVSSTGLGITGDIEVNSPQITLDNQGKLNAESESSNGGNITVNSDLLLLRRGAQISTSATTEKLDGNGGNININSRFILAVPNENSNISANAFRGKGGNIKINSRGIFGIQSRAKLTPESDITASSELGVSGVKNINTPDNSSIPNSFTGLSQNAIDTNVLIANSCISRGIKQQENSFTITGSGALSTNRPGVWVSSYRTGEVRGVEITSHAWKKGNPIIEPQGLYRLPNGQLILSRSC
ncbi:MAG: filamentous hemagglutinin N-terminal domain-containing protein [Nostoc sp.]|uniref:two-partner secretion domain-containing protein n=1 Tax=Nostoc sp. TaxID=1180 RepID=UPI002FF7B0CC